MPRLNVPLFPTDDRTECSFGSKVTAGGLSWPGIVDGGRLHTLDVVRANIDRGARRRTATGTVRCCDHQAKHECVCVYVRCGCGCGGGNGASSVSLCASQSIIVPSQVECPEPLKSP